MHITGESCVMLMVNGKSKIIKRNVNHYSWNINYIFHTHGYSLKRTMCRKKAATALQKMIVWDRFYKLAVRSVKIILKCSLHGSIMAFVRFCPP